MRVRAERGVTPRDAGVGWGEPQANPNTRTFTRLATLGFACGSPQPTPYAYATDRAKPKSWPQSLNVLSATAR